MKLKLDLNSTKKEVEDQVQQITQEIEGEVRQAKNIQTEVTSNSKNQTENKNE